jgi:hypothetical protein
MPPRTSHRGDPAAAALLARVRAGEADLPADAVRSLVRAYLDLLDGLEAAPTPLDVEGVLDARSPYTGWYREVRAARLDRSGPARALDGTAAAPHEHAEDAVERRLEEDRQAARALVAAFARDRQTPRARPRSSVRGGGRRG